MAIYKPTNITGGGGHLQWGLQWGLHQGAPVESPVELEVPGVPGPEVHTRLDLGGPHLCTLDEELLGARGAGCHGAGWGRCDVNVRNPS